MINGCQGLVRTIAWRVHQRLPKTVDLDDLIGYGQVGLAEAARDFDETKGSQFVTYAWYRVRGASPRRTLTNDVVQPCRVPQRTL
ncbi:MAG UNVERIFIED_CONTAM: hypothetical protein LVR18_16830 [Planctomycetaceae bacterium]